MRRRTSPLAAGTVPGAHQDLVALDSYLHVLLGLGGGRFGKAQDRGIITSGNGTGPGGPRPSVADFDQDGRVDLPVSDRVLFGMNGCNFSSRFPYTRAHFRNIASIPTRLGAASVYGVIRSLR